MGHSEVDGGERPPHACSMARQDTSNASGFPQAPSQEAWDAMSPAERERVLASLPGRAAEEARRAQEEAQRAHEEARRAQEEAQRAREAEQRQQELELRLAEETRRREDAERQLAELRAELERREKSRS